MKQNNSYCHHVGALLFNGVMQSILSPRRIHKFSLNLTFSHNILKIIHKYKQEIFHYLQMGYIYVCRCFISIAIHRSYCNRWPRRNCLTSIPLVLRCCKATRNRRIATDVEPRGCNVSDVTFSQCKGTVRCCIRKIQCFFMSPFFKKKYFLYYSILTHL